MDLLMLKADRWNSSFMSCGVNERFATAKKELYYYYKALSACELITTV